MHRLPVYKQMNYITNYETNQLLLLVVFKKNKKYYDLVIRIFKYIQYSKQFNIHIAPIRPKNFFRSVSKFFLIFFFSRFVHRNYNISNLCLCKQFCFFLSINVFKRKKSKYNSSTKCCKTGVSCLVEF